MSVEWIVSVYFGSFLLVLGVLALATVVEIVRRRR